MSIVEGILIWSAMFGYLAAFVLYLTMAVFKKNSLEKGCWRVFIGSFLLQTAAISWRCYVSGRLPVMVSYEHYQMATWFIGFVTISSGYLYRQMRIVAMGAAVAILLLMGMGFGTESTMDAMRPPFKSNWLAIHIGFSWFGFACFVLATVMAIVYLRKGPGRKEGAILARFPAPDMLDDLMMKQILFGVICQGLAIIAGAIWAHQLWGRYWGWDPIETWGLIYWLTYGAVLHLRLMMGWRGKKLAILILLALSTAIVSFWGIGLGPQSHTSLMLLKSP